jgi:hypothetical protein
MDMRVTALSFVDVFKNAYMIRRNKENDRIKYFGTGILA